MRKLKVNCKKTMMKLKRLKCILNHSIIMGKCKGWVYRIEVSQEIIDWVLSIRISLVIKISWCLDTNWICNRIKVVQMI